MICPNCMVQMHQKIDLKLAQISPSELFGSRVFAGGGTSTDEEYTTWTIQTCPECGREVKEFYSVTVIKKGKE